MATWYVNSAAAGTGAGTSWANACTTLAAAIALSAAGDDFNVLNTHAETSSSAISLVFKGTAANPNRVFCCDNTNSPAQSSDLVPASGSLTPGGGATITCTSVSATITVAGVVYIRGVTFSSAQTSGNDAIAFSNSTNSTNQKFELCVFEITGASGSNSRFAFEGLSACVEFLNCSWSFGIASNYIDFKGPCALRFRGSAPFIAAGSVLPTLLFKFTDGTNHGGWLDLDGLDLSGMTSGTLVGSAYSAAAIVLRNCKLNAGATVADATTNGVLFGNNIDLVNCDSGATSYRNERYHFCGTMTTDTVDVRAGGANDGNGTPYAWKVVTTANPKPLFPFEVFDLTVNIPSAQVGSSRTLTLYIMSNATLTNADIWPEVSYMGNSGNPEGIIASGGLADPLASNNGGWPLDVTSSWTTTGVSGPVQQTMSVSFTPQLAGLCRIRVKVAKASQTLRIDPYPVIA